MLVWKAILLKSRKSRAAVISIWRFRHKVKNWDSFSLCVKAKIFHMKLSNPEQRVFLILLLKMMCLSQIYFKQAIKLFTPNLSNVWNCKQLLSESQKCIASVLTITIEPWFSLLPVFHFLGPHATYYTFICRCFKTERTHFKLFKPWRWGRRWVVPTYKGHWRSIVLSGSPWLALDGQCQLLTQVYTSVAFSPRLWQDCWLIQLPAILGPTTDIYLASPTSKLQTVCGWELRLLSSIFYQSHKNCCVIFHHPQ